MMAAPSYTFEKNILKFYIRLLLYLEDEYIKDAGFRDDTGDDNYLTFVGNALDKTFVELLGSEINKEGTPYNIDYNTVEAYKPPPPPPSPPPPSPPQPSPPQSPTPQPPSPQPSPPQPIDVNYILEKISTDSTLKKIKDKLKYKSKFFKDKFLTYAKQHYEEYGLKLLDARSLERHFYEIIHQYQILPTPFAQNDNWQDYSKKFTNDHLKLISIIKTNQMLEPVRMFLSTEGEESVQNRFIFDALAIFKKYDLFTPHNITDDRARELYEMVAKIIIELDSERNIFSYADYKQSLREY